MNKSTILKISIILFFVMFIYSGFQKINNFPQKVEILKRKTGLPLPINELGMIGVIILEIIGSLLIIYYFYGGKIDKQIIKRICELYLLFLIVVTYLYHPPTDKPLPFLSNITTFAGLLLIYNMLL
tara:strand:- start:2443 stop:2820 length:378 start_codon:yes stop_codon:yes gene_type:complete